MFLNDLKKKLEVIKTHMSSLAWKAVAEDKVCGFLKQISFPKMMLPGRAGYILENESGTISSVIAETG